MHQVMQLPDLIEEIYDAALEPALWNDVIVGINAFVGGQACGLISKDSTSQFGFTHYYCGADPHYIELYAETYSRFDPLSILPPPGRVVSIPDLVDYDEYRRGRFYQEWLQPQGCIDVANVVLEQSSPNCAVLMTALPGAGMMDDDMRRRIALVAPHADRALRINTTIGLKQSEAATFAGALNGLGAGIFFLDANRRMVHANTAGHDMLRAGDFLRCVSGQIVARNGKANQAIRDCFTDHGCEPGGNGAAIPLSAHDGERYVAHILPLTSAMRSSTGAAYNAVAALFVRKVALEHPCGELLARTFELTPTELRVLLAIVEIGGVPETAAALGIAPTTVKTHLHRVFSKTGVNGQVDLVKLVAGFSNPLAS